MRHIMIVIILVSVLVFSSISMASGSATLPPLKQVKNGIGRYHIECKPNSQLINKREDGSPACVTQTSFTKLLSIHWGFDPNKQWVFDGLQDTYSVGKPIIFSIKYQGFHSLCIWPNMNILQENKTVWTGNFAVISCPPHPNFLYLEKEWKTGLNSDIGNLVLNQTGTYSVQINGNYVQKNITVIP